MKRIVSLAIALVLLLPCLSWSFGFVNISDVEFSRLDASTFRLRVTYDWGGAILPWPTYYQSLDSYGPADPSLEMFDVTGVEGAMNLYSQNATPIYTLAGSDSRVLCTGNVYGFDFAVTDPSQTSFTFNSYGEIHWYTSYQYDETSQDPVDQFSESFASSFVAIDPTSVPEPATFFLVGAGLLGTVAYRRKHR
jgi:hypothetical protein